jgi:6-phosphogluconolactonase/glucosamine-6-phosphate isomerase/deaminase
MKFILTAGWEDGVADLTERLVRELASGQQVLWLVSGGSNIPASVQIMNNVPSGLQSSLSVMLADERYGEVGHNDSNWAQLMNASFNTKQITPLPVLQAGLDFESTVSHYQEMAKQAFTTNEVIIAQLGIGEDGHIAGILPNSAAATETEALAIGYQSTPFKRLTLTFAALRQVSAAYAFAFGNTKHQALIELQTQSIQSERQPAQILKLLPETYIYSDQLEQVTHES